MSGLKAEELDKQKKYNKESTFYNIWQPSVT